MKFPSFFPKKKPAAEYYFGLFLKNDEATGFIFESKNNALSILTHAEQKYTKGWEEILDDTDKLISTLESNINAHITKTIFFLHSYFIDAQTQEIKTPYKDIIKNIAKSLELKPLGFIELHEAMKEYIKQRDEAPLNAVFVELDTNHLSIYAYKGDKEIIAQHAPRSHSLAEDIEEILLKNAVTGGNFPSRMIVYGLESNEDAIVALQSYSWKSNLFLHPPKIEHLSDEELNEGMKKIFAEQMLQQSVESPVEREAAEEQQTEKVLGFAIGEDVALHDEYKEEEKKPTTYSSNPVINAGGNISNQVNFTTAEPDSELDSGMEINTAPKQNIFSKFSMPTLKLPTNVMIIIPIVLLVLMIGGVWAFENFVHKVSLKVFLPSQSISKTIDLSTDEDNLKIQSDTADVDITAEKSTTGSRDIGQSAEGQVMIHNFDNQEKTIAKGTKISLGNLQFSLDEEVKVASASGVSSDGTKQSGKAKVAATASNIGPEYNIASGKQLTISDLSDALFIAIVDTAFTGGTKKKVQTVSKADLDSIDDDAIAKAKKESASQVDKTVKSDKVVLTDLTEVTLKDKEYTKEVGEESNTVGVKAKGEITYYTIPQQLFKEKLISALQSEIPSGYKMDESQLDFRVESSEKDDDDNITLEVKVENKAVKDISAETVRQKIAGKFAGQLKDILKNQFEAEDYEVIKTSPPLPIFGNWMPFTKKNIEVTISSK